MVGEFVSQNILFCECCFYFTRQSDIRESKVGEIELKLRLISSLVVCPFVHLSVLLSVIFSVCLSVCLSVYLSVCLSVRRRYWRGKASDIVARRVGALIFPNNAPTELLPLSYLCWTTASTSPLSLALLPLFCPKHCCRHCKSCPWCSFSNKVLQLGERSVQKHCYQGNGGGNVRTQVHSGV